MAGGTVKPFSQARLWGQKHAKTHRFLKILPQTSSNHLNDQSPSCVLSLHFCAELRIDFLGACKPRGLIDGGYWRILADHGGPTAHFQTRTRLWIILAMYKEIWTERRTLIFYLYKPTWECLIPLACPQPSSFLAIFPDHSLQGKNAKVPKIVFLGLQKGYLL